MRFRIICLWGVFWIVGGVGLARAEAQSTESVSSSSAAAGDFTVVPEPAPIVKKTEKPKKSVKSGVEKQAESTQTATQESPPVVSVEKVEPKPLNSEKKIAKQKISKAHQSDATEQCQFDLAPCLGKRVVFRAVTDGGIDPKIVRLYPEGPHRNPHLVNLPMGVTAIYTRKVFHCSGPFDVRGKVIAVQKYETHKSGTRREQQYAIFADQVQCPKVSKK